MKIQLFILLCSFNGLLLFQGINHQESFFENEIHLQNGDIVVGTIINDSTGQISISNSLIKTSIINNLKVLNNAEILNAPAFVSMLNGAGFLVFEANSVTGKTIVVAVELTRVGNTMIFQKIAGKQIHVWEPRGNCSNCLFEIEKVTNIMKCKCILPVQEDNEEGGCDHLMFITQG